MQPSLHNQPKVIVQVIPSLTREGISSVVMNWLRAIDRQRFQFHIVTFNDGPLRDEIESLGCKIDIIPTLRQSPVSHIKAMYRLLSARRVDVIHIHNSFKNGVALWLAKLLGVKTRVCHSHTAGLESTHLKFLMGFLKWLVISASNVRLACGYEAGKFLYGKQPFDIINNAIAVERFYVTSDGKDVVAQKYNLPSNKRLILHVGRFSEVKNQAFLVNLAQDKKLAEDIHFVCVGEGPLKTQLLVDIKQKELSDKFTFLPENDDIPLLLASATGYIMPSLFEGVSVALLEAQAASLPCLISDTIAAESEVGLGLLSFLSLADSVQWITKLNELEKSELAQQTIANAFYQQGFSLTAVVEKIQQHYTKEHP